VRQDGDRDLEHPWSGKKCTDLELLALKDAQVKNLVYIRWVHGEAQLANGLTKGSEYKQLELFYSMTQSWRIVEDVENSSARKRKALGLGPLEPRQEPSAEEDSKREAKSDLSS
jgi:hypothetical protein